MSFGQGLADRVRSAASAGRLGWDDCAEVGGEAFRTSVIKLLCAGLVRISGFRLGLSLPSFGRRSRDRPLAILGDSPNRGFAPAAAQGL
jgi:hypothetical protein